MAIRIRDGEDLTKPHRMHLYQILANEKGIDHWKVSVGYGLVQLAVGLSILFLKPLGAFIILLVLGAYFVGFCLVSHYVRLQVENRLTPARI